MPLPPTVYASWRPGRKAFEAETLTRLTHSLDADESREQTSKWLHANDRFHDAILQAAGLPMLKSMAIGVRRVFQSQPLWLASADADAVLRAQIKEHAVVAAAIVAGSAEVPRP